MNYRPELYAGWTRWTDGYEGAIKDARLKNAIQWECGHRHHSAKIAKGCAQDEIDARGASKTLMNPGSYPDEIEIRYEDGKVVRLPSHGLPGLLHMAGDGTLDWMVEVFEPMRKDEDG